MIKDGDVVEIKLDKLRRVGNILRGLRKAAVKTGFNNTEFLHRYSKDMKTVYIKRLGEK